MIKGENISLRSVNFSDAPILLEWENSPENWSYSDRQTAYTFKEILQLIESAEGIESTGQKRWMIVLNKNGAALGTLDVFEYNSIDSSIGVGILIQETSQRKKGFASEALKLLDQWLNEKAISMVHCLIQKNNEASVQLFSNCGFQNVPLAESNSPHLRFEKWLKK